MGIARSEVVVFFWGGSGSNKGTIEKIIKIMGGGSPKHDTPMLTADAETHSCYLSYLISFRPCVGLVLVVPPGHIQFYSKYMGVLLLRLSTLRRLVQREPKGNRTPFWDTHTHTYFGEWDARRDLVLWSKLTYYLHSNPSMLNLIFVRLQNACDLAAPKHATET